MLHYYALIISLFTPEIQCCDSRNTVMVDYIRQHIQGFIPQEGDLGLPPSPPTTTYNSQSL